MGKIIAPEKADSISQPLHEKGNTIVLAGGCFDILHVGHITFLQKAKEQGDVLIVLLENDETIRRMKGEGRPINTQEDRGLVLASLSCVDYVVSLPNVFSDKDYDGLVLRIKPAIIAITRADPYRLHKERQANLSDALVVDVTNYINNQSTTRIANLLKREL